MSINYTKQALSLAKNDYSLQSNLADAYFRNNDFDQAISIYKTLIKNNFKQENTFNYYGTALFNKKEYSEAIKVFKEGIRQNSNSHELWLNYGNSLAITGNLSEASFAFEKAHKLNPSDKNTLKFLTMIYQQLGNIQKANFYYAEFTK